MPKITTARAWANNEVAYVAWDTDAKIADCLGFEVTRIYLETWPSVPTARTTFSSSLRRPGSSVVRASQGSVEHARLRGDIRPACCCRVLTPQGRTTQERSFDEARG